MLLKKNKLYFSLIGLSLLSSSLILSACASSKQGIAEIGQDNKKTDLVERRIDRELEKRARLVRNNPLYTRLVETLNEGRVEYKKQNYEKSFSVFSSILNNSRFKSFPEYGYSKYYIAQSLSNMGAYYASLLYYVDIVENDKLRVYTHESLRQSIAIAQHLKDDELILYLASTISDKKVPKSLKEEFRYFVAKDLYLKKNYRRAIKLLYSISKNNRLYLASRYLLGTIAIKNNSYAKAIDFYKDISNERKNKLYYEETRLKQLANLALGRIYYEQRNYPLAIVYYKKVQKDNNYYPQGLYESSWALFKMRQFNASLSVLHSVNSPFYEQVYFLKSYLLKGAIFLELCLYDDALTALSGVEDEFKGIARQIDNFAKSNRSPKLYYNALSGKERQKSGKMIYRYRDLFNLASANRDFWGIHQYIESLQKERELLGKLDQNNAKVITNLITQKERELTQRASWLAGQKLKQTRQLIEDFFTLKDFLRYEIVSTERKILQTRSLRLAPPVDLNANLIKPKFTDSLRESMVWWEYTGEYWADEVGYYLYNLKSICKDTTSDKK
ncbi:MAG TPA: hypothetical protein PKC21_02365 [Oligoflexia bacterium]|nr:hypothetical protein [Oligoflexia bacterium]HMR24175.1 hypothetical protein [Oligoflexia bacterium]